MKMTHRKVEKQVDPHPLCCIEYEQSSWAKSRAEHRKQGGEHDEGGRKNFAVFKVLDAKTLREMRALRFKCSKSR